MISTTGRVNVIYWKSSRQYRSGQDEKVPEDVEHTMSHCSCGMGTVRETRKGDVCCWNLVPEDWCETAD
jgi:hypothetical protein